MDDSTRTSLDRLEPLLGEWSLEAVFPGAPPSDVRGELSPDGATISGAWEKAEEGSTAWEHDFHLIYRRVASP